MKERPLPMNGPMVRATMAGAKTQTRRVLRKQPNAHHWESIPGYELKRSKIVTISDRCAVKFSHSIPQNQSWDTALDWTLCPYGQPGDRLWVREAWRVAKQFDAMPPRDIPARQCTVFYEAGGSCANQASGRWEEDLNYSAADAGDWVGRYRPAMFMPRWASRILLEIVDIRVERLHSISMEDALAEGVWPDSTDLSRCTPLAAYRTLWNEINGAGAWDLNPWLWSIHFRRLHASAR